MCICMHYQKYMRELSSHQRVRACNIKMKIDEKEKTLLAKAAIHCGQVVIFLPAGAFGSSGQDIVPQGVRNMRDMLHVLMEWH